MDGLQGKNANADTSVVRKVPSWEPSWAKDLASNECRFPSERVVVTNKCVRIVDQEAERRSLVCETGDQIVEVFDQPARL